MVAYSAAANQKRLTQQQPSTVTPTQPARIGHLNGGLLSDSLPTGSSGFSSSGLVVSVLGGDKLGGSLPGMASSTAATSATAFVAPSLPYVLDLCMSALRRGYAKHLCTVPNLT